MQIDLADKVVMVTGCGRGIGRVVVQRFAREGARIVLLERDSGLLSSVTRDIQDTAVDVEPISCDVSQAADVRDAVDHAIDRFGSVDVLINNAGVCFSDTVEKMDVHQWDETFAVNTRGVFLCSQAVVPIMKKQRFGRIMNAASFAATIPSYALAAYSASKAAVVSFTRVLAAELGPWNVTVNCFAPGMIPTDMNRFAEASEEHQEQLLDTLTLRRWGSPDDIASLLIFLASDWASYITGVLLDISGGKYAVQFPGMAYAEEAASRDGVT